MPTPIWTELRTIADQLELEIHLASMDARARWQALKPRVDELQATIAREGDRLGKVVSQQLVDVGVALRRLRDDLVKQPKA